VKGSPLLQVRWMLQDAKASLESLGNARWLAFALSIRTKLMTSDANLPKTPFDVRFANSRNKVELRKRACGLRLSKMTSF
jgi:hypothetical protein